MDSHGADSGQAADNGYTVAELCRHVEAAINTTFPDEIWVRGIISGLKRSANGHVYFDLVDPGKLGENPEATLPVALFMNARQRVNAILRKSSATRMTDGAEIRIRGAVAYYPRQGRVQLIMSLIDPAYTLGQLEIGKAQLLAELRTEGLLDANRRRDFPAVPLRVALITSANSAAEADFLSELGHSGHRFDVTTFDSRVQGLEAVDELTAALAEAGRLADAFDVVAIVRGGGARTDLAAFDHGRVARAIAACPLPVVVGVGHETDSSVADLVAARTAKTPTACAGLLIEAVRTFDARLSRLAREISARVQWRLVDERRRLATGSHRLARVSDQVAQHHRLLDLTEGRLRAAAHRQLDRRGHQLETAELKIGFLDPAANLARGWSIVHDAHGGLVRSVDGAPTGHELVITVADGRLLATSRGSQAAGQGPSDA